MRVQRYISVHAGTSCPPQTGPYRRSRVLREAPGNIWQSALRKVSPYNTLLQSLFEKSSETNSTQIGVCMCVRFVRYIEQIKRGYKCQQHLVRRRFYPFKVACWLWKYHMVGRPLFQADWKSNHKTKYCWHHYTANQQYEKNTWTGYLVSERCTAATCRLTNRRDL